MIEASLILERGGTRKTVSLSEYLSAEAEEQAHNQAYVWIKSLRNLTIDGQPFRQRFTAKGDSLWWFTEIYLHKERVILDIFRAIAAIEAVASRDRPQRIQVVSDSMRARHLLGLAARSMNIQADTGVQDSAWWRRLAALDLRARRLTLSAYVTPDRFRRPPTPSSRPEVAAFIHRAFWKAGGDEGSAESYIGPVLRELERRAGADAIRYVGIGPQTNFRERRRWSITETGSSMLVPVERYAPIARLRRVTRSLATALRIVPSPHQGRDPSNRGTDTRR